MVNYYFVDEWQKRRRRKKILIATASVAALACGFLVLDACVLHKVIFRNGTPLVGKTVLAETPAMVQAAEKTAESYWPAWLQTDFKADGSELVGYYKERPLPPVTRQSYDYSLPVPESAAVTDDFFQDAAFIGNSQAEGIKNYSVIKNADVFASKGIMVDNIFTKEVVKGADGQNHTIIEMMGQKTYGKIYIMLGMNELGWAYDNIFIERYGKLIDTIKEKQPQADIYIQSILPVSLKKSQNDETFNNQKIQSYNSLIKKMATEKQIFYVDAASAVMDENGALYEDASTDGIHLNKTYYLKWYDYIKTHTVVKE